MQSNKSDMVEFIKTDIKQHACVWERDRKREIERERWIKCVLWGVRTFKVSSRPTSCFPSKVEQPSCHRSTTRDPKIGNCSVGGQKKIQTAFLFFQRQKKEEEEEKSQKSYGGGEGREGVYAETAPAAAAAAKRLKLEGAHTADGSAEMWATVRCRLRGWSRGEESSGMWGGLALRGWQVNEPPLPVFWCSNRWFASCGAACLIAPLWFLQPLLSDALLSGDTGRERAREEERERERERGESVPGELSHSFIFIFTRHMFACQEEEEEEEKVW